jgi:flagellin-like hook-associated protein FlgL
MARNDETNSNNNSLLVTRESVLEDIRNTLEQRFNELRTQAQNTTNVWDRYEIEIILKELKHVYNNIII